MTEQNGGELKTEFSSKQFNLKNENRKNTFET